MDFPHIIRAQQFDRQFMEGVFALSERMRPLSRGSKSNILAGKIMAALFYQPSTRTRLSFESAMLRLGGQVISTENARQFSSAAKGETLEDTIKIISGYSDVIVLRHDKMGAAERATAVSGVPIINAGDGPGQHPTQALLDIFTIQKEIGSVDGVKIAMVGDLANGRTVRSLTYLLSKFDGVEIYFVAPEVVKMKDDIKDYLTEAGVIFVESQDLISIARIVDVLYQTRIQKEYFDEWTIDYEIDFDKFVIDQKVMSVLAKDAVIMHPLPRVDEIDRSIDGDPRAAYFRQAENGLIVRMALLCKIFDVN